jgi:hypothetical protein
VEDNLQYLLAEILGIKGEEGEINAAQASLTASMRAKVCPVPEQGMWQ